MSGGGCAASPPSPVRSPATPALPAGQGPGRSHRSPGVLAGSSGSGSPGAAAAAAAAAAACWSPLVSNSLHGYSLYGGGGGGSGCCSSSLGLPASRRPPALTGWGVVTGNGYQAPCPTPSTARPRPPPTGMGGRGISSCSVPLVDNGACQRGSHRGGKGRPTSLREGGRGLAGGAHRYQS